MRGPEVCLWPRGKFRLMTRYIPVFLKHSPTPRITHFATLNGLEAVVRGVLSSSMPLAVYETLGSAEATSATYFVIGICSMIWGFMVPAMTQFIPRRWMYSVGCLCYMVAMAFGIGAVTTQTIWMIPASLLFANLATATTFVCINAYVLDYIARENLGRTQSTQMFFAALPWTIGPVAGVWLRSIWPPAPFVIAAVFASILLVVFWVFRMGNGKQISRAKGPAANPLAYLGQFLRQPRLIAGWLFAVVRSTGWWVYIIYLPIFCVEAGLGDKIGGIAYSISNAGLFMAPVLLRLTRRASLRSVLRFAFASGMVFFLGAALLSPIPLLTVACCVGASLFLITLDIVGGLPFMMAVRPSERTEMAAVYSSFRDVSGIMAPGLAWGVLLVAPLAGIFAATAGAMAGCYVIAGKLHPRLGNPRPSRGNPAL